MDEVNGKPFYLCSNKYELTLFWLFITLRLDGDINTKNLLSHLSIEKRPCGVTMVTASGSGRSNGSQRPAGGAVCPTVK